jgi:hypothetical protein
LSEDSEQAKKWLENIPDLDDMYRLKSVSEIEVILNNWLSGGSEAQADSSDGTMKGSPPTDELEKLVSEVKTDAKSEKSSKKAKKSSDDDEAPVEKKSLDDAFNELMNDD